MRIAITGSKGFIGRRLMKKLLQKNHEVREIDILNGFDIVDWNQIKNIDNLDYIIHLAAKLFIPESFLKPRDFLEVNISGTSNVLELSRINKAKLIFNSSYIYGKPEYLPIDENHPCSADNPYSESKIIGERLCKLYNSIYGVKIAILRPFNVYGPQQSKQFLLPKIIAGARAGKVALNDPRPRRDFVYVDDLVNVFLKIIEKNDVEFEIYNVGSGNSYSVAEIVEKIRCYYPQAEYYFTNVTRKHEIMETIADIKKIQRDLKWFPEVDIDEGLHRIIRIEE